MNWRQLQKQKQIIMQKKIVLGADDFSYRDISAKELVPVKKKEGTADEAYHKSTGTVWETIHWISESEDSWKNFLSCMGRLYQLDFLNTCMVYAQRPDASVLAGYDAWLEMDLPVARGSKGIAVFPSKIFGKELPMFMIFKM